MITYEDVQEMLKSMAREFRIRHDDGIVRVFPDYGLKRDQLFAVFPDAKEIHVLGHGDVVKKRFVKR